MPKNIPTWKEMTSFEGWATFNPDKKNRIREKWLLDVKEGTPKITDSEIVQLRDSIYTEEQTQPSVAGEQGLVPPTQLPDRQPPQLAEGQPDILPGKLWDYNTETGHAVVKDDAEYDWRDASDDERVLIQGSIPREDGELQQREASVREALVAAGVSGISQALQPFHSPLKFLGKVSAPMSAIAGGIAEAVKDEDRGVMETIGASLKAGYESFGASYLSGEVKDASTIRKELKGKTFEEEYGLLWGTLANLAGSILIDPLIVGGIPVKAVKKIERIARGTTKVDEAVSVLSGLSKHFSPEINEIIKTASSRAQASGLKKVAKKLPALPVAREVRGIGAPRITGALEAAKIPSPAIPTQAGRRLIKEPKAIAPPETGFKIVRKGLKPAPIEGRKALKPATTKELPLVKTKGVFQPRKAIELPPAKGVVGASKTTPKPQVTPKMAESEIAREVNNVELIDTVEKFVASGKKIVQVAPKQHRYRTIVGKETVKQINKKAAYELGIDVEVLRGDVKTITDTVSEYTTKAAKYGDDDGVYLGSILGAGAKYFEKLLNRGAGKTLRPSQGDEFIKKSFLSVEKPWEKISKAVGFRIKNMHSRMDSVENQALDVMKDIARIGRTGWRGISKPGVASKKFVKEDLSEIPLAFENKEYFNKLPIEVKKRIKPAMDRLGKFFKDAKDKYAEYGVDLNFKGRLISNMIDDNSGMLQKIREIKAGNIKRMGKRDLQKFGVDTSDIKDFNPNNMRMIKKILAQQIKDNTAIGKRVKNLEYVHIPYAQWFDTIKRGGMLKALKVANAHKRKTLAISDLVESGAIAKGDINVFDIIGSYGNRMAKDFAILDIKKAAIESGLAARKKLPGFVKMDGRRAPLFHDVHMHPAFKHWLYDFQSQTYNQNKIDKFFSLAKMAQFTKPLFLGFYNMFQHSVARGHGLLNLKGVYDDTAKAMKMMAKHGDDYYEALDNGIKSTPYDIPWNQYQDTINRFKTTTLGENAALFASQNKTILKPFYETFWNTAWTLGDELPRLVTYNYLKRKGMSSFESAQTAALFHSDYASVPTATRRFLNRPFFTPTFKMTMAKLYKEMIKASYNVPKKLVTGKAGEITTQEKFLAKGAVGTTLGIMGGMDFTMTKVLGYERDQFARRYYKLAEDEDGKVKESVVVLANPLTLIPKYAQKIWTITTNEGYRDNTVKKTFDQFRYEFHPIIRVTSDIIENKRGNGDPVYHPYADSDGMKWAKRGVYATKEIIKLIDDWVMPEDMSQEDAKRIFRKDVGFIFNTLTAPMRFNYLRGTRHERLRWELEELKRDVVSEKNKLIKEGKFDSKTSKRMSDTLLKKQIKLQNAIIKAEEEYEKQVVKLGLVDTGKKSKRGRRGTIKRGKEA